MHATSLFMQHIPDCRQPHGLVWQLVASNSDLRSDVAGYSNDAQAALGQHV